MTDRLARGTIGAFAAFAFAFAGVEARAADTPPAASAPRSALSHVASEIAEGLEKPTAEVIVAASSLVSDVSAPKGDDLAVRIAAQVAGRLGVARAHPEPLTLAAARRAHVTPRGRRVASLVYLQVEIAKGELRVTADLYPVVSNVWDRLRNPLPGPHAHAFSMTPIDAEVRSFLAPVVLEQAALRKAKHDEGEILALGCGDVDGDGGLELVTVTRARVALGRLRGGRLLVERAAPWSTLASRAPVPMRDPLAAAIVAPRAHHDEIFVGLTDRGGVVLDRALVARRPLVGLPVPGGEGRACVTPKPEASAFDGDALPCDESPRPPPRPGARPTKAREVAFAAPSARYDAIASFEAVSKAGASARVVAVREPNGKLRLRLDDASGAAQAEATIDNVGAQIAVTDLDLDGVPEIVTTSASGEDEIRVTSFEPSGRLRIRKRWPAKDGVRALAACPPEERGVPGLVAVVGNEVWLVR